MQPANGALRHRQRMVVLQERGRDPVFRHSPRIITLREKPAVVAKTRRDDDHNTGQGGLFYLHAIHLCRNIYWMLTI